MGGRMKNYESRMKSEGYSAGYTAGYERAWEGIKFWLTIFIVVALVATFAISCVASIVMTQKYVEINSKVYSVEVHNDLNYVTATFANGKTYNINFPGTENGINFIDFDDGDNVILRLVWSSIWIAPNDNDCWGIVSMVKY
jgi:hypothetical protein